MQNYSNITRRIAYEICKLCHWTTNMLNIDPNKFKICAINLQHVGYKSLI